MSRSVSFFSVFIIITMFLLTLAAFILHYWLRAPLNLDTDLLIRVDKGDSLTALSYRLNHQGILPLPKLLIAYAKLTQQTQLKIGEYNLLKESTPEQLLSLLQSDKVVTYQVTLVEGKTFKQWLAVLAANEKIISILDTDGDVIEQLGIDIQHPEGWFFPDTYQFVSGETDRDILRRAYRRMVKVLDEEWAKKADNLSYKSAYEALIMASIIEKETGVAYERAEIAGVFVRRLQKGMRLQTDPTIIYGLGDDYKGNIRRKHLRQRTPYNTYMIDGLPPTPIAMPGRESIRAALNPQVGTALYFVAKGDGSHHFSETLEQHNKAVYFYQIKKREKNYRSAPK